MTEEDFDDDLGFEEFMAMSDAEQNTELKRAGKKGDPLEDLKKARWYLDREINKMEETYGAS